MEQDFIEYDDQFYEDNEIDMTYYKENGHDLNNIRFAYNVTDTIPPNAESLTFAPGFHGNVLQWPSTIKEIRFEFDYAGRICALPNDLHYLKLYHGHPDYDMNYKSTDYSFYLEDDYESVDDYDMVNQAAYIAFPM